MSTRAEVLAALAITIMDMEKVITLANITNEVPLDEYGTLKMIRRALTGTYSKMAAREVL